jgi:abortive infection bacteriophage resistance protein
VFSHKFQNQLKFSLFTNFINCGKIKNKYRGQFPIWVAVNLLTLGNLKYLYKNIPSRDRKNISKELNLSPGTLDSWIDNLRILRNKIAHNMRLYGV